MLLDTSTVEGHLAPFVPSLLVFTLQIFMRYLVITSNNIILFCLFLLHRSLKSLVGLAEVRFDLALYVLVERVLGNGAVQFLQIVDQFIPSVEHFTLRRLLNIPANVYYN